MESSFTNVSAFKPKVSVLSRGQTRDTPHLQSSRTESVEQFLVGKGFRPH
jgi:hypothetical protein